MEYQKIINLLDNKFTTKNWVEINDDTCGSYSKYSKLNLRLQC